MVHRESDQFIVPKKPGNAGGGKGLAKRRPTIADIEADRS